MKTLREKIEEILIKVIEDAQDLSSGYNAKICLSYEIEQATKALLILFQEEIEKMKEPEPVAFELAKMANELLDQAKHNLEQMK